MLQLGRMSYVVLESGCVKVPVSCSCFQALAGSEACSHDASLYLATFVGVAKSFLVIRVCRPFTELTSLDTAISSHRHQSMSLERAQAYSTQLCVYLLFVGPE